MPLTLLFCAKPRGVITFLYLCRKKYNRTRKPKAMNDEKTDVLYERAITLLSPLTLV